MDDSHAAGQHRAGGRAGGRDARRALRAAPLAEDIRPVRAGMAGGRYRPLGDADVLKIHRAALDLLEQVGLADAPPSGVEILTAAGCHVDARGRMIFPRAVVEDAVAKAGRSACISAPPVPR